MTEITIRNITFEELSLSLFDSFNRFQKVDHVWCPTPGGWVLRDASFTEQWEMIEYVRIVDSLERTLLLGGAVVGAFADGKLLGFASVENEPIGVSNQYVSLSSLHVTFERRRRGIGRKLFNACCHAATERGAKKLLICADATAETQEFYFRLGCTDADKAEVGGCLCDPFSRQLEIKL